MNTNCNKYLLDEILYVLVCAPNIIQKLFKLFISVFWNVPITNINVAGVRTIKQIIWPKRLCIFLITCFFGKYISYNNSQI